MPVVQPRVIFSNGKRFVPVCRPSHRNITSGKINSCIKIVALIPSPTAAEVRAAAHTPSENHVTTAQVLVLDEHAALDKQEFITSLTHMLSDLASSSVPHEVVWISTSQSPSLWQYLMCINRCSEHSATHVIMHRGSSVDEYLAAFASVPSLTTSSESRRPRPGTLRTSEGSRSARDPVVNTKPSTHTDHHQPHSNTESTFRLLSNFFVSIDS